MPGTSYGLPMAGCRTGQQLAKIEGSVCSECSAGDGNYRFPSVRRAQFRRLAAWLINPIRWERTIGDLIDRELRYAPAPMRFHRWFDAGDLQSPAMLRAIVRIAERLPAIRFWLPTHEHGMVRDYLSAGGTVPPNLTIRLSAPIIGREPGRAPAGVQTSTIDACAGYRCPARQQGNRCGDCRACWDPGVANVDYELH